MSDVSPELKSNANQWLDEYGDALFRYALRRVGSQDIAEDVVQETFVAALRAADRFEGRSQVLTWLTSILRNKITDYLRKQGRQRKHETRQKREQEPSAFKNGHWIVGLRNWRTDPASSAENQEFWRVIDHCLEDLPHTLKAAFRMRDLEQLTMGEICETLEITSTNLSVRLHRARLLLRACLDKNWFATEGPS